MKLLYFTNIPAPYRIEFFNLINKKCELTVVFDYKKEKYRNKSWYKNNVFKFNYINLPFCGLNKLNEILNKNDFDAVIIGTYASFNGAILINLLKIKHIKFYINADGGFINYHDSFIEKHLKHHFISRADFYLSTGYETNKYLQHYGAIRQNISIYSFSSLNKSDILSKPINKIMKIKLRKIYGYDYDMLFISVGSFIYRKGYDIFLESIKHIKSKKKYGFIIIGGGELINDYNLFLKENNIKNVHFIDFCSKDTIFKYYQLSDVFFIPSREDIWGLVINEAMANGLPVISSNKVLAAKELLNNHALYNFNDSKALARLFDMYLNYDTNELKMQGLDNINKIKKYTIENMVDDHIKIIYKNLN